MSPVEKELHEKFPRLFAPAFDVSIGKGWLPTVLLLSEGIEGLVNQLPESERAQYTVAQVKEKFGGLRYYMSAETKEMSELISMAEEECWRTCEDCGAEGSRYVLGENDDRTGGGGWIRTLCADCAEKAELNRKIYIATVNKYFP